MDLNRYKNNQMGESPPPHINSIKIPATPQQTSTNVIKEASVPSLCQFEALSYTIRAKDYKCPDTPERHVFVNFHGNCFED